MVLIYCYLFVLGSILGSFFNVVGLRIPLKKSIVKPRSHCTVCSKTLGPFELIPVLSYILQKGKCRHCGSQIPLKYPFIELITGILFTFSLYKLGINDELLIALSFISLLVIIFVSDITYMVIPNKVLLFFAPILLVERLLVPLNPWWDMFIGAVFGFGLLLLISVISRGGMGGGDIKLFFIIGLVLGLKLTALAFFLSTIIGAAWGLIGILIGKFNKKQAIPFGPFIVLGSLLAYFYGNQLIDLYVNGYGV